MAEFKYEITERIAVLSQSPNGWERQLLSLIHILTLPTNREV